MQYVKNLLEVLFALTALVLACLFCAYAWPESTYGIAAWVQAIGSIAAILGAVWAAVHASRSAARARDEDAREAGVSQVIFTRALFRQASNILGIIQGCAATSQLDELHLKANELASILDTLRSLIVQSRDSELASILVRAYESLVICQSQSKSAKERATDMAFAEFTASAADRELNSLREELKSVSVRIRAPAEPAGPAADFDVLTDEDVPADI